MPLEDKWQEFRSQMPVADEWVYLDHAAVAPLSGPAQRTFNEWAADVAENGDTDWDRWRKGLERIRTLAADLIKADRSEIALIHNTTEGVNLVAEGFPWKPGDNVVLPTGEFPTNLYPWLNQQASGVEVRQVPTRDERVDLEQLDAACNSRTRIIAISWIGYATGWRNDVDALVELAHRNGAYLFLDAIQGLGAFPIDLSETSVDFLAADSHKWLLGPEGAGIFFTRREHLDLLRPLSVGWNSVQHAGDFMNPELTFKQDAGRYEGGSYNMAGLHAMGASLELLAGYGVQQISQRILAITDELCERLREIGATIARAPDRKHRSGIVSFELPGHNPQERRRRCREQGIVINCRSGRLRASPHAYNDEEDIERLISALVEQQ